MWGLIQWPTPDIAVINVNYWNLMVSHVESEV